MLITADWVLPVSRPPIRDGAVLVRHGLIQEVGRACDLSGLEPEGERRDFGECVLMPGLVNAHTHLSLTALAGLLPPAPLEIWMPGLVQAIGAWDKEDHAASAALGATQCLRAGVTVVGDITYGPEAPAVASDQGLGGTFFWEVLGIPSPRLYAELEAIEFPATDGGLCGPRIRCGLSPHAPYTAGPQLIVTMHEAAQGLSLPLAMHVAESAAEVELLQDGTGPLASVAARLADGFTVPHRTPVAYIDQLGALDGMTVVHAGHVGPVDVARLSATARGVVTCPRSNRFLSNPIAPVVRLLRAGVPVGIGTDSCASNKDLDLMEEIRALRAVHPSIPPATLIEIATVQGAVALGLENRFGVLEPGIQADIAVFNLGETDDPESAVIRQAGEDTLEAVLSAGLWRVLDGQMVDSIEHIESAALAARIRAEHALSKV